MSETPASVSAVATAFGLLMVAATEVQTSGTALIGAVLAATAVIVGIRWRPAATMATVISAGLIALTDPAPVFAALSGLSAVGYLVLRHSVGSPAQAITRPTVVAALVFATAGLAATAIPVELPWVPLFAPVAVIVIYVLVVQPFAGSVTRE
ncbi:MAG TPA: hypothetical protein VIU87_08785 [Mycobacterium sp.]